MNIKKRVKWLFSRWYLYVITLFIFLNNIALASPNGSLIATLRYEVGFSIGMLISSFFISCIIVLFFTGIIKGIIKLKEAKDNTPSEISMKED